MRAVIVVVILGVVGFLGWQQFSGGDGDQGRRARAPAPVTIVEVEARQFQNLIPALGTLQAWESIDITAPAS